jgi:hypothetical protein
VGSIKSSASIEPVVLALLIRAKLAKSVRVVNGLVPGTLTAHWLAKRLEH